MSSQSRNETVRRRASAILLTLVAFAIGCAHATPNSGFIEEPGQLSHSEDFPFKKEWYAQDIDWSGLRSVYIAPVDTKHLQHMSWWQSASLKGHVTSAQVEELGNDLRARMRNAFEQDENKRFTVVSTPRADTLVIELAIVELAPTKAWLNAVEYASLGTALSKGYVAIESRWRKGPGGPAIATIADGMSGRPSLASAADLTWWGHARNAFGAWSQQFVQVADTGWSERVRGRSPVALVTW